METVKYYYTKPITFFKGAFIRIDGHDEVSIPNQKMIQGKRMTIAALYDEDDHEIRFGMAICHETDKFVKKIGQEIALKQAREKPFMIITHFSGKFKDFLDIVRHTGHMEERKFYTKYYKNYIKGILND